MRDLFSWQSLWLAFGLAVLIGALVMSLVALLTFLEFDLEISPAWQVGVYYLMLSLLLSIIFVVAFQRPLGFGERFRMVMLVLAVLTPVAVFAGGWVLGGAYSGFRDERIFDLVVVSVSSFALPWMAVFLPCSWFLLARAFFRQFRRLGAGEPR